MDDGRTLGPERPVLAPDGLVSDHRTVRCTIKCTGRALWTKCDLYAPDGPVHIKTLSFSAFRFENLMEFFEGFYFVPN